MNKYETNNDQEVLMTLTNYLYQWEDLEKAADKGDWEEVCSIISLRPLIMEEAFDTYYEQIPDEMKYEFVRDIYTHNGDKHENICEALRDLRKYGTPVLPQPLHSLDVITVYRGELGDAASAAHAISWTVSKNVAEWFANRSSLFHGGIGHVYEGKIHRDDIIAYTNCRKEQEIMQSDSVYDVHEIPFVPGRVQKINDD